VSGAKDPNIVLGIGDVDGLCKPCQAKQGWNEMKWSQTTLRMYPTALYAQSICNMHAHWQEQNEELNLLIVDNKKATKTNK
jgi:hypothetical protein